jgi:hypothetical protein
MREGNRNRGRQTTPTLAGGTDAVPREMALEENFANLFNPETVIRYKIQVASMVRLNVYDILSREVATLVNERKDAGSYSVQWNANRFSK